MNKFFKKLIIDFKQEFKYTPTISGEIIRDGDECCNCGEDLSLELYEAFDIGYQTAIEDVRHFLTKKGKDQKE